MIKVYIHEIHCQNAIYDGSCLSKSENVNINIL